MNYLNREQTIQLLQDSAGAVIYLLGAGGCGMSGMGHLLLDRSWRVAGSDLVSNRETELLRRRGAAIFEGHREGRIREFKPVLVAFSSAIHSNHPELREAVNLGIPCVRRATLLSALVEPNKTICVAGMHGKTTTTGLLAYVLNWLDACGGYAIGGRTSQLSAPARYSPGAEGCNLFPVETDESDGTLREFCPAHAILLNLDRDHMDYFEDFGRIREEFRRFAEAVEGKLVYCLDDPHLHPLVNDLPGAVSFGFHPDADYRIELDVPCASDGNSFQLFHGGELLGRFRTVLIGRKNVSNAVSALALLNELGFPPADLVAPLAVFQGVGRRQQLLYADSNVCVFEDYGHHPTEIEVTLDAFHTLHPSRLLVAFQPHRYSRTRHLFDEFARCFQRADHVWITDIYAAGETPVEGLNGDVLVRAAAHHGCPAEYCADAGNLPARIRRVLQPGDLVLFLGAGDIGKSARALIESLKAVPAGSGPLELLRGRLSAETFLGVNEPMARRTTLKVGGPAQYYAEPAGETDLSLLVDACRRTHTPVLLLGRGSNLLVRDGGVSGMVIKLSGPAFRRMEFHGSKIWCGAGVKLKDLAVEAKRKGLAGLEFLEGIPGSVGGALRMNAGAMGREMFQVVSRVRFMEGTGEIFELPANELEVAYRRCVSLADKIALGAWITARVATRAEVERTMAAYSKKRWESQPASASAGCIFKNPASIPAGKLVEELGLKGRAIGGAAVSDRHGNFIVNQKNATAADMLALIDLVQKTAFEQRGIHLETEVQIVGEDPPSIRGESDESKPPLSASARQYSGVFENPLRRIMACSAETPEQRSSSSNLRVEGASQPLTPC